MRSFGAALALLLLGTLRAFPKDHPIKANCDGDPSYYTDEAAGSCCYRCPSGFFPTQSCPQGPAHCRKRCTSNHYLNEAGRCTACVSCLRGDLVEKAPCSWNSSRICECRPGMFCATSAANSCARCFPHSACPEGMVIKFPGTAEKNTVCEPPSTGASPDCASPGDCRVHTSPITSQATPILKSPVITNVKNMLPGKGTHLWQEDAARLMRAPQSLSPGASPPSPDPGMAETDVTLKPPPQGTLPDCSTPENSEKPASTVSTLNLLMDVQTSRTQPTISPSSTGTPILDPGPVLFWVTMVLLLVAGSSSFLLCYWKACRRRVRQKLHLYYPAQTFRPKLEQADFRPMEKLTQPRNGSVTEVGSGSLSLGSPPAVETCVNVGATCSESLPMLDASPAGSPLVPRDPPEPRMCTENTNNRIEKIYIMKADTVIVGTVNTELSESRVPAAPVGPELEVDHIPHYPEQETEPPLDSCTDVMFSVEEEKKENPWSTTSSEK